MEEIFQSLMKSPSWNKPIKKKVEVIQDWVMPIREYQRMEKNWVNAPRFFLKPVKKVEEYRELCRRSEERSSQTNPY